MTLVGSTLSWTVATMVLLVASTPASAGWYKLCNRGQADLSLLIAEGGIGLFAPIRQHVQGWISLPARTCEDFNEDANTVFALAFVARDSNGRYVPIKFESRSARRRGPYPAAICGPEIKDGGASSVDYLVTTSLGSLGQSCSGKYPVAYPTSDGLFFGDGDGQFDLGASQAEVDAQALHYFSTQETADAPASSSTQDDATLSPKSAKLSPEAAAAFRRGVENAIRRWREERDKESAVEQEEESAFLKQFNQTDRESVAMWMGAQNWQIREMCPETEKSEFCENFRDWERLHAARLAYLEARLDVMKNCSTSPDCDQMRQRRDALYDQIDHDTLYVYDKTFVEFMEANGMIPARN